MSHIIEITGQCNDKLRHIQKVNIVQVTFLTSNEYWYFKEIFPTSPFIKRVVSAPCLLNLKRKKIHLPLLIDHPLLLNFDKSSMLPFY